ncbi:MAG: aerial mycelium formation protein [Actinomycetota bacterium]
MSELLKEGGKRRLDRVLAPGFTGGLGELDEAEVRERRDLSRAEREYLSLLRRLIHGRLDILRAERERRASGGEAVVDRLASILAEGPRGPGRGEPPTVPVPEEEMALARRRVERLVSDTRLSDLENLSDDDLAEAVGRLEEEERDVSNVRKQVITALDRLQEEIKRRWQNRLNAEA